MLQCSTPNVPSPRAGCCAAKCIEVKWSGQLMLRVALLLALAMLLLRNQGVEQHACGLCQEAFSFDACLATGSLQPQSFGL
jgi:hypothetical protein